MSEILEALASRIKSPLFGYVFFAFIIANWKPLFYLWISTTAVVDRFEYFDENTSPVSLLLVPLAAGVITSIAYPWVNVVLIWVNHFPTDLRNYLQANTENKFLMEKQRHEIVRKNYMALREDELIERAKRDQELEQIEDEAKREKLKEQLHEIREISPNEQSGDEIEDDFSPHERKHILIDKMKRLEREIATLEKIAANNKGKHRTPAVVEHEERLNQALLELMDVNNTLSELS